MEYITRVLLLKFFVAYASKQLYVRFNTALLLKYAYSEFKCHRDDQRHRDAVVVVCSWCHVAKYCGAQCQQVHWCEHRPFCRVAFPTRDDHSKMVRAFLLPEVGTKVHGILVPLKPFWDEELSSTF